MSELVNMTLHTYTAPDDGWRQKGGCVMKFLFFAVAVLLFAPPADNKENKVKIERALSAGPAAITNNARVVDADEHGNTIVLREGSNGFTCMPGNLKVVGEPPMCVDAAAMQWYDDAKAHKPKPTNTVPGITYMLAGATQRSDSDPNDTTSMPIEIGPHWMIMWPFDPKTTGLPTTHEPTGAYIMWAGSAYAHLHVMGRP